MKLNTSNLNGKLDAIAKYATLVHAKRYCCRGTEEFDGKEDPRTAVPKSVALLCNNLVVG
jgi:hypothetical protein